MQQGRGRRLRRRGHSACILGETWAKGYDTLVPQAVRDSVGDDVAFEELAQVPPGALGAYRVVYE